jgi:molybdopterin converting factor small subunit
VVRIELYGVPRLRAGVQAVDVHASTIGDALLQLQRAYPQLEPDVLTGGKLNAAYVVAIDGGALTRDPQVPLSAGDTLVLLTSQAGG